MPWELAPNDEGLCLESLALNDEGLCPESYYFNTLRAYALIGTTCMLKSLSLHLSKYWCRCRQVVNDLISGALWYAYASGGS